jgi:hypothetical protein
LCGIGARHRHYENELRRYVLGFVAVARDRHTRLAEVVRPLLLLVYWKT